MVFSDFGRLPPRVLIFPWLARLGHVTGERLRRKGYLAR